LCQPCYESRIIRSAPGLAIKLGEIRPVRSKLFGQRLEHADRRGQRGTSLRTRGRRRNSDIDRQRLLPARHRQVNLRQQPCIEQRAVQRPLRVRDPEALAQCIEAVLLARKLLARQRERVDDLGADSRRRRQLQTPELVVEEGEVERRVVNDPPRAAGEIDEFPRNVAESRLFPQGLPGQAVHVGCSSVDFAFGVDVKVNAPARQTAIDDLDGRDLDNAMAQLGIESHRLRLYSTAGSA